MYKPGAMRAVMLFLTLVTIATAFASFDNTTKELNETSINHTFTSLLANNPELLDYASIVNMSAADIANLKKWKEEHDKADGESGGDVLLLKKLLFMFSIAVLMFIFIGIIQFGRFLREFDFSSYYTAFFARIRRSLRQFSSDPFSLRAAYWRKHQVENAEDDNSDMVVIDLDSDV